jgi:hypothetical protein
MSYCKNRQELHVPLLLILFEGEMTLGGDISARFRCTRCQLRGARIKSRYVGPTNDGR